MVGVALLFLSLFFSLLVASSSALPLCTDSSVPVPAKKPLPFCSYKGNVCCSTKDDARLRKQFQSMNVSDTACAAVLKAILCATCDQYSAELFGTAPAVPVLCNATVSKDSPQSSDAALDYCSNVWSTCQNISIQNSPFAASLQGPASSSNSNSSKLTDLWQSEKDFCRSFGGSSSNEKLCFSGSQILLNTTVDSPPQGLCIEKIGDGMYLDMAAHPDGSGRVFLADQEGKVWLATVPKQGSGGKLTIDESNPFLDITDEVHYDSEFGLMGIAFHPDFTMNGRFFVSYNCDKSKSLSCLGRCACNSDVGCSPSQLGSDNGALPCTYGSVIAEYTVNSSSSQPSQAIKANPLEVRRIFTMGLPFTSHHGGQILFGPADKHLYYMMGDGGGRGDPFNFAQNKKSLLGKIMRLDVDNIPREADIDKQGFWGNYSIPKDNPFSNSKNYSPEIWALGLRNPWRCSFDSLRPSYFLCADVGQETYEEVDLITKGGNYGWRVYEGPYPFTPLSSPGGNTTPSSIEALFPVMGYNHSFVSKSIGSASITGGYYYRSTEDPCMYGRYIYADLYASALWASLENPSDGGNFTSTLIPYNCASDSPIPCNYTRGNPLPTMNVIFSFGQDNNKDLYLLSRNGVYRVVRPSRCNYTCSKEIISPTQGAPAPKASSASTCQHRDSLMKLVALYTVFFFILNLY